MPIAAQAICHLRSKRSANQTPMSGPSGLEQAMMKVYSSEVVTLIHLEIRNCGTHAWKP